MINDENTDVVEVEQKDDTVVEEETTEEPVEEDELAKAKAEAAKYRRLLEKAQKPKDPAETKQATPTLDPVEAALLVGGMSKEVLGQLKKVSALIGKDLIESQTDPIFVAVKEKFEKDQKREKASLPASRGAGAVKVKKDFMTPGLTREEHMALVQARS